jgi:CRP/FNR family cyclic AMP-dependent transcriptional regulator
MALIKIMGIDLTDVLRGEQPQAIHIMGNMIIPDDRVLSALHNSGVVENLRDFEISVLTSLIAVKYYEARELVVDLDDVALKDALMILVEGAIEVSAMVNNEPVSLHLETPGDLARIMSFVGGDRTSISSTIKIRKDSAVLLLQRSKLETLMHSHPSIVYCVMRNLVRHVHGVARRKNAEKEELSNYLFSPYGRF